MIKGRESDAEFTLHLVASFGCINDKDKVLLHMHQGTATKGVIYMLYCVSYKDFTLDENFGRTMNMLNTVSEICVLPDDKSIPHCCNQGLVFSSGTCMMVMHVIPILKLLLLHAFVRL